MLHDNGISKSQAPSARAVGLFEAAAIIPGAPVSVRQLEMINTATNGRLSLAVALLRELATGEPVALHVTIPGDRGEAAHCFFIGNWLNTFVDLGETTTFFVEPDVDVGMLTWDVPAYVQGDCTSENAPTLNPAHSAIWVRREANEAIGDAVIHTRRESRIHG